MTGFVHMLRSTGGGGDQSRVYSVMFAPIGPTGTGGALTSREFRDVESLRAFLKSMRVDDSSIQDALEDLDVRGNASVPNIDLSQEELAELGLQ
jgi:hypothetical protein